MCTGVRAVHQRKHSKGVVHLAIHDPLLKSFLRMHTRPMRRIIQARSVVCPADARSDALVWYCCWMAAAPLIAMARLAAIARPAAMARLAASLCPL